MKHRIAAALTVLVLTLSLGVFLAVAAQPDTYVKAQPVAQQASISPCTNWSAWQGTSWGQFRWCYALDGDSNLFWYRFQVDDILTDGYAVHLEVASSQTSCCPPDWNDWIYRDYILYPDSVTTCFQSTGPVVTSYWPGTWVGWDWLHVDVKLVRGHIGSPCGSGSHQMINYATYHLTP